ncbi:MAG: hypothetical protein HOO99_10355 [Hyphomicrobiaceae bacterium]|nr:hypothetical protein [Hyphomicrobiaceae bacterium]
MRWIFAIVAYGLITFILWGDPFKIVYGWRHPFNTAAWAPIIVVAIVGLGLARYAIRKYDDSFRSISPGYWSLLQPTMVVLSGVTWIWFVSLIGLTYAQSFAIAKFNPDYVRAEPIRVSILNAPYVQFGDPHGVAVKDCKPYIWSFRQMGFVEVGDGLAINIIPEEWRKKCGMPLTGNDLRK